MKQDTAVVEYGFPANSLSKSDVNVLKKLRKAYDQKRIYDFKNILEKRKNFAFIQEDGELCLLETILQSNEDGCSQFISLIWVVCEIWEDESVLIQQNTLGKLPIEYVIESKNNENLFCFLIYDIAVQFVKRVPAVNKYQLKLKNDQLIKHAGFSIFHKIYQIVDFTNLKKCLIVLEELLIEMKEIVDIKKETDIEYLLNNVKDADIKESIIKIILKYWKIDTSNYEDYRKIFENISPFFHLYFSLIENDEEEFVKSFPAYFRFMKMKETSILEQDCKHLLFFADQEKQEKAIKLIVGCYTNDKDLSDDYIQFMIKMIRNGFYLGHELSTESKDEDWVEPDMLKKFLNSCVSNTTDESGNKHLKIDYTCLVDPEIRNENLMFLDDDPGILLFNKSLRPVSVILNNDKLKHLITHPMIALFATLKGKKFQKIHNFNLYTFLILYVFPFLILFMSIDSHAEGCRGESNGLGFISEIINAISRDMNNQTWVFCLFVIAISFVTVRELIQFFISDSKLKYLKRKSNILEVCLIVASWCFYWRIGYYRVSAAFIILISSIEILMLLPTSTLSTYMFMLKTVSATFMKFFWIFLVIILAFTFCFYSLFRPVATFHYEKDELTDQVKANITMERCEVDEYKNFDEIVNSFIKTTLMIAGNISAEPHTLSTFWEKLIFFVFLITALVLINLINGLAISDIQELKVNALFHDIKQRIRNGEESENFMCGFYWKARLGSYTRDELLMYDIDGKNNNCWNRLLMWFSKCVIERFPYLHKMDNLKIDYKLRNVEYFTHNQELVPILSTIKGSPQNFYILNEDFEEMNEIIKDREANNDQINEDELAKLDVRESKQEIVKLKKQLERIQNDSEILMNFLRNEFIEMKANMSNIVEQMKITRDD